MSNKIEVEELTEQIYLTELEQFILELSTMDTDEY